MKNYFLSNNNLYALKMNYSDIGQTEKCFAQIKYIKLKNARFWLRL